MILQSSPSLKLTKWSFKPQLLISTAQPSSGRSQLSFIPRCFPLILHAYDPCLFLHPARGSNLSQNARFRPSSEDIAFLIVPLLVKLVYQSVLVISISSSSIAVCSDGEGAVPSSAGHEACAGGSGDYENILWVGCKLVFGIEVWREGRFENRNGMGMI